MKSSMVSLWIGKKAKAAIARFHARERKESNTQKKIMLNKITAKERRYLAGVKELPCGVCGAHGPSEAHHIVQNLQYLCVPLCVDCHRGSNGWHGTKALWKIRKLDEFDVLNDTIRKLLND